MKRPSMRTPRRGQGSSRRPTPLPSPPVRGGPKGPPKPRPVRAVPKTSPKPHPTGRGLGGSTKGGPGPMTIARGGKSDIRTPRTQRPTRSGPYGGRVPKRVKETPSAVKKTPPNTGTSSKTAELQKRAQAQRDAVRAQRNNPPVNAVPVKRNLPISQRQPTGTQKAQLEAAFRAAASKPATGGQAKKGTPADLARIRAGNAARNKAPTGSRAAAIRRRRRRGGGGLAGALRRRRARMGR